MDAARAYAEASLYVVALVTLAAPVGRYIHAVLEERLSMRWGPLWAVESGIYRLCQIDSHVEMGWRAYAGRVILFNVLGALLLYGLQRLQALLPLNPAHLGAVTPDTAFNTAISFASNTSWQSYVPESTVSYLSQLGITAQSFLSGATGIAVLMALVRGFRRVETAMIGNFWVDLTRSTLYILLPVSLLLAVLLVGQGSIQTFGSNRVATLMQSASYNQPMLDASGHPLLEAGGRPPSKTETTTMQVLSMGPVASQTAIGLLSGDGGGFFNANSAHPYANPTPLSNFLEMLAILLIPGALCHTLGRTVGDRRHGWAIFATMAILLAVMSVVTIRAEQAGTPYAKSLGIDHPWSHQQPGGNMEGKEERFGVVDSALFAAVTTGGGDGAVDSMHDSYTPVGGLVPMLLMQLGEVVFGAPGSGLYGMLMYAIIAIFIASLMIGRAPEYLGKTINAFELKMATLVLLVAPLLALIGTAFSVLPGAARASLGNPGAHGFSEVLYAFSSTANNNGSAFAGLSAGTPYYNVITAVAMWLGRFIPLVAVMALAGSLAEKKRRLPGSGTLPTHGLLFIGLLLGTVLLIGALTWLPAIAMGPIAEQLQSAVQP